LGAGRERKAERTGGRAGGRAGGRQIDRGRGEGGKRTGGDRGEREEETESVRQGQTERERNLDVVDELSPGHVAGEDLFVGKHADGVCDAHGELRIAKAPAASALVGLLPPAASASVSLVDTSTSFFSGQVGLYPGACKGTLNPTP